MSKKETMEFKTEVQQLMNLSLTLYIPTRIFFLEN